MNTSSIFTESLSHEMVIVQTKALKNSQRSLLEGFLSNFLPEVQLTLEVNPRNFDRKYVSLLKRLETATMKKEIIESMQRENLLQQEWDNLVLALDKARKKEEEARKKEEEAFILLQKSVQVFHELGMSGEEIAYKLGISPQKVWEFLQ